MNYSTAVMLINQNIRAIHAAYTDTTQGQYQRTTFKTLDPTIKKGDIVVVQADKRRGLTVMQVTDVDVDVDYESDVSVDWIVSKVDPTESQKILQEEAKWIDVLKKAERRKKAEEIKTNLLEMYKNDGIEEMPIAIMSTPGKKGNRSPLLEKPKKEPAEEVQQ